MKYYRVDKYRNEVEEVEVKKVTDHFVVFYNEAWKSDQREAKKNEWFPTFGEAKNNLIDRAKRAITYHSTNLARAERHLREAMAMTNPVVREP